MDNPWNIQSIYELQFFLCPSCIFKNHSKQELINHAYEYHPDSIEYLMNIDDKSLIDIILPWNEHTKEIKSEPQIHDEHISEQTNFVDDENHIHIDGMLDVEIEESEDKDIENTESIFGNDELAIDEFNIQNYCQISFQNGVKKYSCNFCGKIVKNIKKHIKDVHASVRNHKCDQCARAFSRSCDLIAHIKSVHEGIKNYKCESCNKGFTQASSLNFHIKSVHEGVKYQCDYCDKAFTQKINLKNHILNIHASDTDDQNLISQEFNSVEHEIDTSEFQNEHDSNFEEIECGSDILISDNF